MPEQNTPTAVQLSQAEADLIYGMLTQRLYLRSDDPDRQTVEVARAIIYPATSAHAEAEEALRILFDSDDAPQRLEDGDEPRHLGAEGLLHRHGYGSDWWTPQGREHADAVSYRGVDGEALVIFPNGAKVKDGDEMVLPPNPVVCSETYSFGTARYLLRSYRNGTWDASEAMGSRGAVCSLSPGFDSRAELLGWIREEHERTGLGKITDDEPELGTPTNVGLRGKYYGLRRTRDARQVITDDGRFWLEGGSLVEGWYFVIREGDEAGWAALEAYADACESYAPELAADLRAHVRDERLAKGLYDAGWER